MQKKCETRNIEVIIKNLEGKIILYTKGADSIIEKLLNIKSKNTDEFS